MKIIKTLFLILTVQCGFAQGFNKAKLDSFFYVLETNNKWMGSAAISKGGKVIYTQAVGYADVEANKRATANTKYRIGSITKTFTAVLVLQAIEEKKLMLTETVDKYFPTIKNTKPITISQLLSHRSGIHNFTADEDYLKWNTQSKSEKELIDLIAKGGFDFEPDSKFGYSNSNYVLLTLILQKVYKKTYAQLLISKIVTPLQLTNTYVGTKTDVSKNESCFYAFKDKWVKELETDMSVPLGAASIVSTPTDLITFSNGLFDGKLLSSQSLELMKTMHDGYGMGLFEVPFYDKTGYGHNGRIDGFNSVMYHFANEEVSVSFLSNGSDFDNNQVAIALLSAAYNNPIAIPDFKTIAVTTEMLDRYLGVYGSADIPLKITVTKSDKTLVAQATGQPSFEMQATEKDIFKFAQAGIVMEFDPAQGLMLLRQGGVLFHFKKE